MPLAPVEYLLIEFPGNAFTGEIAPEIASLVERGLVHILDLVFVMKDADGEVTTIEYGDLDDSGGLADVEGEADGLLGEDDVALAAESLAPGSSALFILWEDLWAGDLARAMLRAGGTLVAGERIPHAVVEAAVAELETEEASA